MPNTRHVTHFLTKQNPPFWITSFYTRSYQTNKYKLTTSTYFSMNHCMFLTQLTKQERRKRFSALEFAFHNEGQTWFQNPIIECRPHLFLDDVVHYRWSECDLMTHKREEDNYQDAASCEKWRAIALIKKYCIFLKSEKSAGRNVVFILWSFRPPIGVVPLMQGRRSGYCLSPGPPPPPLPSPKPRLTCLHSSALFWRCGAPPPFTLLVWSANTLTFSLEKELTPAILTLNIIWQGKSHVRSRFSVWPLLLINFSGDVDSLVCPPACCGKGRSI